MPRARHEKPPPELVRLGAALRALREKRDLKQIEAASRAGMTESQISDIERGRNNPGWILVMRLLNEGLEATLAELVLIYENSDPKLPTTES